MCCVGNLNCSQACLTSPSTLEMLRELPTMNPALYNKLAVRQNTTPSSGIETDPFSDNSPDDDSDIPVEAIIDVVHDGVKSLSMGFALNVSNSGLVRSGAAEQMEPSHLQFRVQSEAGAPKETPYVSRSGRVHKPSKLYSADVWDQA